MRRRREVFQGEEADAYLRATGIERSQYNADRHGPFHGCAYNRGVGGVSPWDAASVLKLNDTYSLINLEVKVKTFMIRHSRLLRLVDEDVEWLRVAAEMYQ